MSAALELGNITVSGPCGTGKTYFAAHWAAEKVKQYKDCPGGGADLVLHTETLANSKIGILGYLEEALNLRLHPTKARCGSYLEIGNVTIHLINHLVSKDQMEALGPRVRPVFFVQDGVSGCGAYEDLPAGYHGIRIAKSIVGGKLCQEFRLDIHPVDGAVLPKHNQL